MDDIEALHATMEAARAVAEALPGYQASNDARAALEAAEAEVERLRDVYATVSQAYHDTPECEAYDEAVRNYAEAKWIAYSERVKP